MYKFVRNFKQKTPNKSSDDASSSSSLTNSNVNNEQYNQNEANKSTITNVPTSVITSQIKNEITLTSPIIISSQDRASFTKIKNTQPNQNELEIVKSIKTINESLNEHKLTTSNKQQRTKSSEPTTAAKRSVAITSVTKVKRSSSSSSSSSTSTTSANTTATSPSSTNTSIASSTASLSISSDSLSENNLIKQQTSTLNIVLNKNNKPVLNELEKLLKQTFSSNNNVTQISTISSINNVNDLDSLDNNQSDRNLEIISLIEDSNSDIIMVHSDTNNKKPQQKSTLDDSRYEYISRNTKPNVKSKDEKTRTKPDNVIINTISREPKTVNFRASSLISKQQEHDEQIQAQQQQQRAYRSLSPNQISSVAYMIGQQPKTTQIYPQANKKSILIKKQPITVDKPINSKVYFAQAIGHGQMSPRLEKSKKIDERKPFNNLNNISNKSDEKIYEIHTEPLKCANQRKRIRSPSGSTSQYYNLVSKNGKNSKNDFKRDYNSLLNLANKASFRIRFARDKKDDLIDKPKKDKKLKNVNRSLSVNYLYNKRQFDLRKFQNNLNEIHLKNHVGFTTEDIEDIYMPKRLNQFESKLKASLDLSENSEQEETKDRKKHLEQRLSRQSVNKRLKMNELQSSPRIIINFNAPKSSCHNQSSTSSVPSFSSQQNKSYLEEAKRKLEESRSKAYFYGNLNNKLKSSVTNVMKATHDLARNSDIRQHRNLGRNSSFHEVYDVRRNDIRSNQLNSQTDNNHSYTSDDIDNVYMPWMMENYGRKLVIEALKRRSNMVDSNQTAPQIRTRHKSPYVSQYYAQTNDLMPGIKRNDLWVIDKDIRRFVRRSRNQSNDQVINMETEVSISDSETSSDDTRPIVPEKINKPDISLKNKILKTINKSLLSAELTGIDLNMLKLNDHVRKTSRRVEKKALERDLELDLIRSFSCNHLADLRKEDIRYTNMRIHRQNTNYNSFTAEDIIDLSMPKSLEAYKLKSAIQKEKKIRNDNQKSTLSSHHISISDCQKKPPIRVGEEHIVKYKINPRVVIVDEFVLNDRKLVISPPPVLIKSPNSSHRQDIRSTLPPNTGLTIRTNPNTLFTEIMQERLNDIDHRMAREIGMTNIKRKQQLRFEKIKSKQSSDSEMDIDEEDEAASTDHDQDDSLDHSSTSGSDDLNMNEDEMRNFDMHYTNFNRSNKPTPISKSRLESTINRSCTLKNPGELISDFYISNMNYAMRYSVEHVQKFAKDLRRRREKQDFINTVEDNHPEKLNRSFSVDRLYAVRREHIRYSNGADEDYGARNISFTTDDIQDIYMPSSIDNYKRKIAVELERRRRFAENEIVLKQQRENEQNCYNKIHVVNPPECFHSEPIPSPIVLDDLDIFLIKKAKLSIEKEGELVDQVVQSFQPTIQINPIKKTAQIVMNSKVETYRKESPVFLDTVDMISCEPVSQKSQLNRIQINKPEIKFKPKSSLNTYNPALIHPENIKIKEPLVKLEKANVSIANNLENYAIVNKVSTLIDNEIVPSPSSSSVTDEYATSSNETSDSLDNIDLDSFDLKPSKKKTQIKFNYDFTRQNQLTSKEFIEINRLNKEIEEQTAARLEALNSFNSNNVNILESRKVEKMIEQPNNKVNISIIKTFNLAGQVTQKPKRNETEFAEFSMCSQYTPREANYKIESNDLHLTKLPINDNKVLLLNAPKIKEELVDLLQTKDLPNSPRISIKDPEYIIEEYAHKPIDSSVVYLYENVGTLKAKEPIVNKLKTNLESQKAMSFVSINKDEILEDVGYLEPLSVKQNATLSINKHVLSKLDSKNEPMQLNAPVTNVENVVFAPPLHLITNKQEQKASLVHHDIIPLEKPAHVLVPVNLNKANQNECEDIESMEIDANLQDRNETVMQAKLKETKQPNETTNSIDWVKTNVFSLAELKLDSTELNFAHPFEAFDDEIKQQLSQRENVETLKLSARSNQAAVFNSAQQITDQDASSQCSEIEDSKLLYNPSVATQKNEEFYINLKPSIFKIATLNASVRSQSSFTDENITEEIDFKIDQHPLSSSNLTPHVDELLKPPISKKPVIINHAKLSHDSSFNQETTLNISSASVSDNILKQNIIIKKHSSDLNTVEQLTVTGSIVPFSLAETNKEIIETQRLTEFRPEMKDETTKVHVSKQPSANLRATQSSPFELICGLGVVNKSDEFLESVKPMDTIEIDFNESISFKTTHNVFSPNQKDNKLNIKICHSLNRPASVAENLSDENCDEFILRDHQTESVKTTTETFTTGSVNIQKHPTQLILPHESIDNFNEEKYMPIEVASDYYEPIMKEEKTEVKATDTAVKKSIEKMGLGQINSENNLEEESKELESIHLKLIEPSAPNKIVETKIDIVRIEKQAKPQIILNNPVSNYIETETVKRFQPEELDYERPKFGIEITEVNEDKKVIRIKMLNSPFYKTEEFDEQRLDRLIPIVNEAEIERAQEITLNNDCDLKADVDHIKNFNMAAINDHSENEEYVKETKENMNNRNLFELAEENLITNLNSFSHGNNDIKTIKLNHYGRAQEIIELNDHSLKCDNLSLTSESFFSLKYTTIPVENENIKENVEIKRNQIRNLANSDHLPAEQCQDIEMNQPDYSKPVQITQTNTIEETLIRLHKTSVLLQPSIGTVYNIDETQINQNTLIEKITCPQSTLDNQVQVQVVDIMADILDDSKANQNNLGEKSDNKLLRWLNYTHSQLNISNDESINIDEKLDYLYDKINSEQTFESEIKQDLNMVKVEKVLNRIISSTEKLENEYELVQYVSQSRPELQQLIVSDESEVKLNNSKTDAILKTPLCLNSAISVDQVIEETTKTEKNEYITNITQNEMCTTEMNSFSKTIITKPLVLNRASEIENEQEDSAKVEHLMVQLENKEENFKLTRHIDEKHKHKIQSTTIFNLPTVGRISRLDEMSTEFYNIEENKNVCRETVELICCQTVNNIIEKTLLNAPLSVEDKNEKTEHLTEIKPIDDLSVQLEILQEKEIILDTNAYVKSPQKELIAPYVNNLKYNEEKCAQFEEKMEKEKLQIKTAPNQFKQVCSSTQQVKWELANNNQMSQELIQKTSEEIVRKILLKSIIQSEHQPNETSQQINQDWINEMKNIEPLSASSNEFSNNIVEKYEPKIENKEYVINLNNTDDDIGSFIEQIEKIELISSGKFEKTSLPTEYDRSSLMQDATGQEHVIHHSSAIPALNATRSQFSIEKEKLNELVQNIEVPKWEEPVYMDPETLSKNELRESFVLTNANDYSTAKTVQFEEPSIILNETINDEDISISDEPSISSDSSKIHLIESVEIVTHHNQDDSKLNDSRHKDDDQLVHIHKVDINRLQIREKSPRKYKDLDESSRFKVDFKQEEVMDLRDLRENNTGLDCNETFDQNGSIDLANDKIFARKFVDQIVQLSTSKLADFEAQNQNKHEVYDDALMKYENLNFNKISHQSSSEILESLSNLKINIGKHLTESVAGNYYQEPNSKINIQSPKSIITSNLFENNKMEMNKMTSSHLRTSYYDDDNDSLKEARDEFFENFDNRLHSTYNHGNSTIVNSSIDTDDYFSEKFEEEIEIIKESSISNFQIPIHIEYEFNDQSFSNQKKDKETIQILTEIVRNKNETNQKNAEPIESALVRETMKDYLNNLSNLVIDSVNRTNLSEDETETSIQETVTVEIKNKNENKQQVHSNYETHEINENEKVDEMDEFNRQPNTSTGKYNRSSINHYNIPIDGSSIQKIVEKLPDIQDFDETVEIVDSIVIDHVSEDDKSISSEEVTYERWTEETKLFKTKVFKNGELVNEIVEQSNPELVGDILREKLIERHEHITHISQDVKKRVKTKSPGQSRRQSLDINEILNNDLDGSSVIIVEPTIPSSARRNSTSDNTYYIQHQQVITPSQQLQPGFASSSLISDDNAQIELIDHKLEKEPNEVLFRNKNSPQLVSNISTFYGGLEAHNFITDNNNTDDVLIVKADYKENLLKKPNTINVPSVIDMRSISPPFNGKTSVVKRNDLVKSQYEKITAVDLLSSSSSSSNSSSFDKVSVDYMVTGVERTISKNENEEDDDSDHNCEIISAKSNESDLNNDLIKPNNEQNNNKSLSKNNDSNENKDNDEFVLVDQMNELNMSYCDVNYVELNEYTYQNNQNNERSDFVYPEVNINNQTEKIIKPKSKLECDENTTTTSESLESMERFKRPTKLEMIKQKQNIINELENQKQEKFKNETAKSNLSVHDDDNSSHIDTSNSAHIESKPKEFVSKGFVKNYALMFQQKDALSATNPFTTSSSGSKKINEYLAKFESKSSLPQPPTNDYKKLIDQLTKLNESINLVIYNQADINSLAECTNTTRDLFDLFFLDDSIKPSNLNKRFQTEFEKYVSLFSQLNSSNLSQHSIVLNLDHLKNLIEFKYAYILKQFSSSSSNQSTSLNMLDMPSFNKNNANYFTGSSSLYSGSQYSDKISPLLANQSQEKIVEEQQQLTEEQTKQQGQTEDMTDISDEDEPNIFESSNLIITNSPLQSTSVLDKVKVFDTNDKPRALPLRRESFEMAQKDSAAKRLSFSTSINNNASTNLDTNTSSESSIETASISTSNNQNANQQQLQQHQPHQSSNKRLISEIKPTEIIDRGSDGFQLIDDEFGNYYLNQEDDDKKENYFLNKVLNEEVKLENETSNLLLPNSDEKSTESDSSDSSRHILQRNYDILRKKSNRKANNNRNIYLTTEEQKLIDSFEDDEILARNDPKISLETDKNVQKRNTFEEPRSFVSSSHLISKPSKIDEEAVKPSSKIKVVPKQSESSLKNRSVSPGMLRRGPDIIETIETTTSMSFIMNKRVNLVVEEKRLEPPFVQNVNNNIYRSTNEDSRLRTDKPKLTNAISQPQLYQSEIDDLLNSTGNLIMNNANQRKKQLQSNTVVNNQENSTPIPITVQSRSKSEPRLNMNNSYSIPSASSKTNLIVSHDFNNLNNDINNSGYTQQNLKRRPLVSNGKYYEIPSQCPQNNRITFHKYDSNEIIALVNMPTSYETTTIESVTNETRNHTSHHYSNNNQAQMHSKNFSRSEPNLNNITKKLDSWSVWPDYTVDQDTDSSIISNVGSNDQLNKNIKKQNKDQSVWIKEEVWPSKGNQSYNASKSNQQAYRASYPNNDGYQFEIEVEKRPNAKSNAQPTASVSIDGRYVNNPKVSANKDGRILIENVSLSPGNEIIIQSDFCNNSNDLNIFNKRRHASRLNSNSAVNASNCHGMSNISAIEQEIAAATRISSGYFSGDEFRSYYNTVNNVNNIINAPIPTNNPSGSNYYDQNSSNSNYYNSNNNSCSSPNSASNEATGTSSSNQFNINKFLSKKNKSKRDALEEFNTMYKNLGLEEDEIIFERTNVNDHPLYGKIDIDINKNDNEAKVNFNFCQSSPNLMNRNAIRNQRSRSTNYDKLDHERFLYSHNTNDIYTGLDNSETYSNFSIFNNEPVNEVVTRRIYPRKVIPVADSVKDDMAARRCKPMTPAQLEREIYINHSYLNKSPANLEQSFSSSNYNTSFTYCTKPIQTNEPDIARDDASILNMRKRSNSLSSLHSCANSQMEKDANVNPLILPSPTSADYLRNRIRETALFNVVMNPTKSTNDVELSQILYDDMAYRQLRKDSDAYKLAQIKSAANVINNNNNTTPSTPIVNIATLPLNYTNKNPQQTDAYYQQFFSTTSTSTSNTQQSNVNNNEIINDFDSSLNYAQSQSFRRNSNSNSINESLNSSNNVKTVKMIKQKDASSKNSKQNYYSSNVSKLTNPQFDANRYFTNASNKEINEYYDSFNQIPNQSNLESLL